jgi:Uma2 family endonuclease
MQDNSWSRERLMPSQVKVYYTPDEYLALERKAEHKSEYFDGEIFAMTGASRRHNLVAANILAALRPFKINREL